MVEVKFVQPSVTYIPNDGDPVRKIERAYRICYQSEDKMSEDSWKLINRCLYPVQGEPHSSPLEHVAIIMRMPREVTDWVTANTGQFSYVERLSPFAMCGNLRAFWTLAEAYGVESGYAAALGRCLSDQWPQMFLERPSWIKSSAHPAVDAVLGNPYFYTFRIVTSRDILQEFVRHRQLSFSVESTRYCNYLKKGFAFIDTGDRAELKSAYIQAAENYEHLVGDLHYKPEEARCVLPGGLKTEFFVSGFAESWEHFLALRLDKAAHPDIRHLAQKIEDVVHAKHN